MGYSAGASLKDVTIMQSIQGTYRLVKAAIQTKSQFLTGVIFKF